MSGNKKSSWFGFGLTIGTVLGGLAAFFLSPTSGKQNREEAAKKFAELKKLLEEKELEAKIKEIFGEWSDEAKQKYLEVKDQLAKRLAQLKEKINEIDKEKYVKVVNEITVELKKEFEKEAKFTGKIADKLHDSLVEDWKKITTA